MNAALAALVAGLVSGLVTHRLDVWRWRGAASRTARRLASGTDVYGGGR